MLSWSVKAFLRFFLSAISFRRRWRFGTRIEKIHKQPDEIQRLARATLRGIRYAKSNKQESVRPVDHEVGGDGSRTGGRQL
jgi:hypothetical protein